MSAKSRYFFGLVPPVDLGLTAPATYLWRATGEFIHGAFAWTGHEGETIQMHYAGAHKHWMTREFLRRAFTYPFQTLGVKVIFAFLPEDKLHARDVAIRLGFRQHGDIIPGVRLWMLTMVREDCRWLNG